MKNIVVFFVFYIVQKLVPLHSFLNMCLCYEISL